MVTTAVVSRQNRYGELTGQAQRQSFEDYWTQQWVGFRLLISPPVNVVSASIERSGDTSPDIKGSVAKWHCSGFQNRQRRFDSVLIRQFFSFKDFSFNREVWRYLSKSIKGQ